MSNCNIHGSKLLSSGAIDHLGNPALPHLWGSTVSPYHTHRTTEQPVIQTPKADEILKRLSGGELWVVNSRRRNGLILFKEFYAEFAGPGAAVGGSFDLDCQQVIPLGTLSLIQPDDPEDHQKALRIRLQWIRLTQNFTDKADPYDRAQMILEQFKNYFDQSIVEGVPDEAFAMLVGVLPCTMRVARGRLSWQGYS